MSWIIDFLMSWGYWGMLVSAFLAGSFFPFSSEVVMSGLQAAGLEPIQLVLYGSIGNVLGSMFNYGVGRICTAGLRTQFHLLNKLQRKQRIDLYRLTAYEKVFLPYYIMRGFRGL